MARKIPHEILTRARRLAVTTRPETSSTEPAPAPPTPPTAVRQRLSRTTREKVVAALKRLHPMD
jgi:hypothetical protein